jgi:hypothetical protein
MAKALPDGSLQMRDGRIVWGDDVVAIRDITELAEAFIPTGYVPSPSICPKILPDRSIQMRDGRVVWGDDAFTVCDFAALAELLIIPARQRMAPKIAVHGARKPAGNAPRRAPILLPDNSIRLRDGRIVWADDPALIGDLAELSELLVPPPAVDESCQKQVKPTRVLEVWAQFGYNWTQTSRRIV